jgi:hypothetical protein
VTFFPSRMARAVTYSATSWGRKSVSTTLTRWPDGVVGLRVTAVRASASGVNGPDGRVLADREGTSR